MHSLQLHAHMMFIRSAVSEILLCYNSQNNTFRLKMEKHLDRVMEEVTAAPGVTGCVFVDHQGLCLGAKGTASTESAGIIGAIAEQAGKLEPQNRAPVVVLETDSKMCIVQRNGTITGAIYKDIKD